LNPAELAEPVGLERLQERFLLEELQVPEALVALVEPAELAEPGVLVQPVEPAVLAELAEPEPLPDEELRDEPRLVAFALVYQLLYDGEVVWFGRETERNSPLLWLSAARKLSKNRVFSSYLCRPGYVISVHMRAWC